MQYTYKSNGTPSTLVRAEKKHLQIQWLLYAPILSVKKNLCIKKEFDHLFSHKKKYVFSLTLHQKISATQSSCLFHSLFGSKFSFPFSHCRSWTENVSQCAIWNFRTLVFVCMYFTLDLNFRFRHFLPFTWNFLSWEFSPSCKISSMQVILKMWTLWLCCVFHECFCRRDPDVMGWVKWHILYVYFLATGPSNDKVFG